MSYFTEQDHRSLLSTASNTSEADFQRIYHRLTDLNRYLYPQLKKHSLKLHPTSAHPGGVSASTAAMQFPSEVMSLTYMRDQRDAYTVEGIMGRDQLSLADTGIEPSLHPVIEIRLSPDFFAVEMVISPTAWYDQQNVSGKLSIEQHQVTLYNLLNELEDEYFLGFWSGTHISDMHLSTRRLPPQFILAEFLSTFAAGRDWFRVGRWYAPEAAELDESSIREELFARIRDLYNIYTFMLWTSNNNFVSFYRKAAVPR